MLHKQRQKSGYNYCFPFESQRFAQMRQHRRRKRPDWKQTARDNISVCARRESVVHTCQPLPPWMRSVFTLITFYKQSASGGTAAVSVPPEMERQLPKVWCCYITRDTAQGLRSCQGSSNTLDRTDIISEDTVSSCEFLCGFKWYGSKCET